MSSSTQTIRPLRVAIIGYGFMGAVHSHAWRTIHPIFQTDLIPQLTVLCGRNASRVAAAATRYGIGESETDWHAVVNRSDVDVVDICTPGDSHCEIAIAALQAGKHVLCEKPLANSVREAEAMVAAAAVARAQGVRAMVGFNYRRVPALVLARNLIAAGELGRIFHVRAVYLQDWIVEPTFPIVWRLQREHAGSGSLGDLGAHLIDLAQYLTADRITSVSALTETFIKERPLAAGSEGLAATGAAGDAVGEVTVDDAALFLARLEGGAVATFEATRFALGRKNCLRIEVNGEHGSIFFDMEALNELLLYRKPSAGEREQEVAGFRRILVTEPVHPYVRAWWPPGHVLGWEHSHIHQIRDFVAAIAGEEDPTPSFDDGLAVQQVLDAVSRSAQGYAGWTKVCS